MKKLRGFTLIELLIILAVLAVIAAIALPNIARNDHSWFDEGKIVHVNGTDEVGEVLDKEWEGGDDYWVTIRTKPISVTGTGGYEIAVVSGTLKKFRPSELEPVE